jgi:hypothetical protein
MCTSAFQGGSESSLPRQGSPQSLQFPSTSNYSLKNFKHSQVLDTSKKFKPILIAMKLEMYLFFMKV